ncbi:uncharacterized protein A1O9_07118 [Exophiala aquamarina CBS 119918]|uniref:AB hydrolase-1 domain-containing protein n=1 Tax=Exophiala aquamarina CBS 119918 TaxID=1182545 RepID=A0A072PCB1_9EURO|nr:uncharacterized protein A1O9_07118 [Exophiala aquamarina CBS 119918]KEF56928.1 hypothetical protein A1O9_07118 [Exophiala aquamarina CBS 119918]
MPFAEINGHSLHYTDMAPSPSSSSSSPDPTAPTTIVFVHGLGSTQNYYFPIITPYLSSFRCIVFDNYGAGRSKYDDGHETSIPLIGKDVLGLLDYLKVSRAVVVGYSMGGMLPTYLASTAPHRVVAGVCIGPVHPSEAVSNVFKQRVPIVQKDGIESMANTIPNAATGPRATTLQKAFIREMLLSQDPSGYIANCRAIEHASPPDYAGAKCPMLIIAGDVDKSAPLAGCEYILSQLGTDPARKRLEVLKGVGHWHCVEAPEEAGTLVKEFVDGL